MYLSPWSLSFMHQVLYPEVPGEVPGKVPGICFRHCMKYAPVTKYYSK